jgi:hypothetical protein
MRNTWMVRRGAEQPFDAENVDKGNGASRGIAAARGGLSAAGCKGWSAQSLPLLLMLFVVALPAAGRGKDKLHYGEGLIVSISVPESEVEQVVADIAQNGVIRGTKEYNKDEFVSGAKPAASSHVFPAWNEGGKVFYKVREQALDPRNFKDSSDSGTLVVRYVVQAQGEKNTALRIDALFKEDFRHVVHQSDGSVENAEYKDIQEHIEAIEVMKKQNVEAERERQEQLAKRRNVATTAEAPASSSTPQPEPLRSEPQAVPRALESPVDSASQAGAIQSAGQTSAVQIQPAPIQPVQIQSTPIQPAQTQPTETLEEHVRDLRKQVERLVKAPGAPLKSAPFHTASTLQSLTPGTEVLILISTTYWYGVETHEGQHGWVLRDQLELP